MPPSSTVLQGGHRLHLSQNSDSARPARKNLPRSCSSGKRQVELPKSRPKLLYRPDPWERTASTSFTESTFNLEAATTTLFVSHPLPQQSVLLPNQARPSHKLQMALHLSHPYQTASTFREDQVGACDSGSTRFNFKGCPRQRQRDGRHHPLVLSRFRSL